ncbi:WXG residues type VII secretion target family protein [Mycobacterium xenopi 3993]|nr:WXG residues type VII secretion target family protein [Mycobacterium xenopi 3993]
MWGLSILAEAVGKAGQEFQQQESASAQALGVCAVAEAFRVDPEALAEAVERMAEFQRYAESMLTEIDSLVSNLHARWSGEAAAAHIEAHRHWTRVKR